MESIGKINRNIRYADAQELAFHFPKPGFQSLAAHQKIAHPDDDFSMYAVGNKP